MLFLFFKDDCRQLIIADGILEAVMASLYILGGTTASGQQPDSPRRLGSAGGAIVEAASRAMLNLCVIESARTSDEKQDVGGRALSSEEGCIRIARATSEGVSLQGEFSEGLDLLLLLLSDNKHIGDVAAVLCTLLLLLLMNRM